MTFKINVYHGIESGRFMLTVEKEGFRVDIIMDSIELLDLINSIDSFKKSIGEMQ